MKVAVVIAKFHQGTTGEYVHNALSSLGHQSKILAPGEFLAAFKDRSFDLYVCVDSGEPLDFALLGDEGPFDRLSMWFIDFRHNKDRESRTPTDFTSAKLLESKGSWIFQSQYEDFEECSRAGIKSCSWLPLAADPTVWRNLPLEEKQFDVGFIGNIWDPARKEAIDAIKAAGFRLGFQGAGSVWGAQAAKILRASKVGFNISSFFGTPVAFDLNMRFFETLACGIPIVTNYVPSLNRIGATNQSWLCTYEQSQDIVEAINLALSDPGFMETGAQARSWILSEHTYQHRVITLLNTVLKS